MAKLFWTILNCRIGHPSTFDFEYLSAFGPGIALLTGNLTSFPRVVDVTLPAGTISKHDLARRRSLEKSTRVKVATPNAFCQGPTTSSILVQTAVQFLF